MSEIDVPRAIHDFLKEHIGQLGPNASIRYGVRQTSYQTMMDCEIVDARTKTHDFIITYQETTGNINIKTYQREARMNARYADAHIPLSQPDSFEQVLLLVTEPHRLDRHINHIFNIPGGDYEFGQGDSR